MASSRLYGLRVLNCALRAIAPVRQIHSSIAASNPSALLDSTSRHALYLPRTVADLRMECKRRKLTSSGKKSDLVQRLASNDTFDSHGFDSATNQVSKRPVISNSSIQNQTASFNTSQALRRSGDDSTIDFAFLPHIHERPPPLQEWIKVPFLPDNYEPLRTEAYEEATEPVIRPEIATIAGQSTHLDAPSAMSEVIDNTSIQIDPFKLTEQVSSAAARSASRAAMEAKTEVGSLMTLWNDFLDDIFGPAKKS